MTLCNCSSTSVFTTALISGTSDTRLNKSEGHDEFLSWNRSLREYRSDTPVNGWISSPLVSVANEDAFRTFMPLIQCRCRTNRPSFAAVIFSSDGANSLPKCGLKKFGTVRLACAARRCGMSEMLTEGGNARTAISPRNLSGSPHAGQTWCNTPPYEDKMPMPSLLRKTKNQNAVRIPYHLYLMPHALAQSQISRKHPRSPCLHRVRK